MLRRALSKVALVLSALLPLPLCVGVAQAQAPVAAGQYAAPRIDGFDVEPAMRLSAGNELLFTLYGSAGGTASVRIEGVVDRFSLEEVEAGVYEGVYTIRNRDRISTLTVVTANLRVGNRIASEILGESLLAGAASPDELKRASDAAALAALPRIVRFEVGPAENLEAGTDLVFTVAGSAGGKASVRINGVKGKLALEEVSAGSYEGLYTIKSRDRVLATSAATATLRVGERESTAVLGGSLLAKPEDMPSALRARAARQCANCGTVESINVVEVNGDGSYVGKIAGGLAGVLLGSQVGSGRGTTAAEIAGAIGGAVAGNEIEKRVRKVRHYDVTARLAGGGTQTITFASEPAFKVGDRIRVENGTLVPG